MLNSPGKRADKETMRRDMKWNELFFIDWHPDVILALCVCFHAVAEMRSELATNAAKRENGEKCVEREERRRGEAYQGWK